MKLINPHYLTPVVQTDLSDPFWGDMIQRVNSQVMRSVADKPINNIEVRVRNVVHNIIKLNIRFDLHKMVGYR